jgi:hypothetical protein
MRAAGLEKFSLYKNMESGKRKVKGGPPRGNFLGGGLNKNVDCHRSDCYYA